MVLRFTHTCFFILIFSSFITNEGKSGLFEKKNVVIRKVEHAVQVHHPGKGEHNIEIVILNEIQGKNNRPKRYYLDAESVICYEKVCKIVSVRIFWNNIGEYQRFKIRHGGKLEKYEGENYTKQDYEKTQNILLNKDSPFKTMRIDEILQTVKSHDIVDAVSGATLIEMNDNDTVKGASLTCYTLWHWANGDIVPIIRKLTGEALKTHNYMYYLDTDNAAYHLFTLEQLTRKGNYEMGLVEKIINKTASNQGLIRASINYIEHANSEIYFSSMKDMASKGGEQLKIASFNSLLNTKLQAPEGYYDSYFKTVSSLTTYQEISLFLRLMKTKNSNSLIAVESLLPLLERDLLIARSAYWYLKSLNLNKKQEKTLETFSKKHKDAL